MLPIPSILQFITIKGSRLYRASTQLEDKDYGVTDTVPTVSVIRGTEYRVCLQMNSAVSKVNNKFISRLTRAQRIPSAAATVQVSHALPAVRFSCLLRGRGAIFQDGVAAGKGFLCAPF